LVYEKFTGDNPNDGEKIKTNLADVLYAVELTSFKKQGQELLFETVDGKNMSESIAQMQNKIEKENIYNNKFLLGTDRYGRDLMSRLMAGTWVSYTVGAISILISLFIGVTLGS